MPKTKLQSVLFTAMMVFCMVFCMTCYSLSIQKQGFSDAIMLLAVKEMWIEYIIVFCLAFFLVTKIAMRLAFRFVTPGKDNPILVTLSVQCMTVCIMVPTVTLIVTILHNGAAPDLFAKWIQTAVISFPMALCTQVFFVGPLVRNIFRILMTHWEQFKELTYSH